MNLNSVLLEEAEWAGLHLRAVRLGVSDGRLKHNMCARRKRGNY